LAIAPNNPEIEHFHLSEDRRYAILKLEEFALFLKTEEKRLIEKEAALYVVRAVLNDDSIEIFYEESGKPYLKNGINISISHSHNYLAVLFSKTSEVGIDIEKVRDKIIQIRRKFLSAQELQHVQNASLEEHTVYWCAKEALYKASGISGLIFAEQLHIEPFTYSDIGGKINALLTHPDSKKKYTLHYKVLGDTILVYTDTLE
jgi:4'-phosphopantetheinyl transferase